jgi:hypothetical protein
VSEIVAELRELAADYQGRAGRAGQSIHAAKSKQIFLRVAGVAERAIYEIEKLRGVGNDETEPVSPESIRKPPFEEWLREVKRIAVEIYDFTRPGAEHFFHGTDPKWSGYYIAGVSPADAIRQEVTG